MAPEVTKKKSSGNVGKAEAAGGPAEEPPLQPPEEPVGGLDEDLQAPLFASDSMLITRGSKQTYILGKVAGSKKLIISVGSKYPNHCEIVEGIYAKLQLIPTFTKHKALTLRAEALKELCTL